VEVRPYPKTLAKVTPIWRAMDRFGTSAAAWRPYWSDPVAVADKPDVKVSAWIRDGSGALLFISHLKREPATARVTLDPGKVGLSSGDGLRAVDAISRAVIPVNGDQIELPFKGMEYLMVEVSKAAPQ
jgi:hypothetical protein